VPRSASDSVKHRRRGYVALSFGIHLSHGGIGLTDGHLLAGYVLHVGSTGHLPRGYVLPVVWLDGTLGMSWRHLLQRYRTSVGPDVSVLPVCECMCIRCRASDPMHSRYETPERWLSLLLLLLLLSLRVCVCVCVCVCVNGMRRGSWSIG
jgi:hypothetical protein